MGEDHSALSGLGEGELMQEFKTMQSESTGVHESPRLCQKGKGRNMSSSLILNGQFKKIKYSTSMVAVRSLVIPGNWEGSLEKRP